MTLEGDIFQPSGLLTGGSRKYVVLFGYTSRSFWRSCTLISYRYGSAVLKNDQKHCVFRIFLS